MNLRELAEQAHKAMWLPRGIDYDDHGFEVAPGFFNIYNYETGQSKTVLYHPESGYIFKSAYRGAYDPQELSRRYVGEVDLDGRKFLVRLPEFHYIDIGGNTIEIQEYVTGNHCGCLGWCEHIRAMSDATNCHDTHKGNWKITNDGEIVLFDFDGIRI